MDRDAAVSVTYLKDLILFLTFDFFVYRSLRSKEMMVISKTTIADRVRSNAFCTI